MHLTAIGEQFNKLKLENATHILEAFDVEDIKGIYDVRTYIAHDYEGVNLVEYKNIHIFLSHVILGAKIHISSSASISLYIKNPLHVSFWTG